MKKKRHDTKNNKLVAMAIFTLGVAGIILIHDLTIFLFSLIICPVLMFSRKNWIK